MSALAMTAFQENAFQADAFQIFYDGHNEDDFYGRTLVRIAVSGGAASQMTLGAKTVTMTTSGGKR